MSAASVNHPVSQSKPAVVIPFPEPITQLELAALCSLRGRLRQLEEQVENAETSLKTRLEKGVAVEPGDHRARLKETFRRNVSWKDVATRLADKLYFGRGLAYVERVLNRTQPTRSVSLVIE